MNNANTTITARIVRTIEGFNDWLYERLKKNQQLLVNMKTDEMVADNMAYLKAYFGGKRE